MPDGYFPEWFEDWYFGLSVWWRIAAIPVVLLAHLVMFAAVIGLLLGMITGVLPVLGALFALGEAAWKGRE